LLLGVLVPQSFSAALQPLSFLAPEPYDAEMRFRAFNIECSTHMLGDGQMRCEL
jgi:hypothetical protein